ncbi:MAG: large subunit ribosomal protein L32 [Myxococcota bacterium]|jgi:large subunit ribosomal protein L32
MPVPKKRTSRSRRDRRRANHDRVDSPNLSTCSRCQAFKMPHRVCGACGYYKNREVIVVPEFE